MANRNVSQLPENTDPQDTDWILGASGNSPSVFQKIAVGNIKPANTGSGGSIKFSLPINENYTLTSSGYYFTYAIAADIEIDCSNLGIGDHIYWQNLSTKSIVFSGLNSIDSISIPANKGIKITSTNFIELFLKDTNKNIKKLQGNHTIYWRPGQAPPFLTFNYSSPGDTNGIIYYLGATKYSSSFVNPNLRGEITANASSTIGSPRIARGAFTRSNDGVGGTETCWHSTSGSNHWLEIQFNNSQSARINRFELWGSNFHDLSSYVGNNCLFQAWDEVSWINLITFNASGGGSARFNSGIFSNDHFYSRYRVFIPNPQYTVIGDLEFYGDFINV